ncbi:MAG: DUF3179 domain-containing protein [Anaerolineales bacterium]|jgi:hypothetical protein|nr:DUF3179 domain-containing protein [Anaerolineales bacterium]
MKITFIRKTHYVWLAVGSLFLSACASALAVEPTAKSVPADAPTEVMKPTEISTEVIVEPADTFLPATGPTDTPLAVPTLTNTANPAEAPPPGAAREFTTDFSIYSIPYSEVLSGGPPKDGIPAIDNPQFVSITEAEEWLEDVEPVIMIERNGDARAYPIQILMWHEIINDEVGGEPVVVTFCPLCNTGIAFERTVNGQVLDFGTTGRLRNSNLIMYDRQTETWWQQATGEGVAGELTSTQLDFLPAAMISWEDFKNAHPEGLVLSRDTGFSRSYGNNPYTGYDDINSSPFLFRGFTPDELPAMARVLTVELEGEAVAYPNEILKDVHVVNDTISETDVVVIWQAGTASALDEFLIVTSSDVGAANVYARELDGVPLTFFYDGSKIIDEQTGSEWNVLGQAVSGELAGKQLAPIVAVNHFWFSWAAFMPETRIYQP